MGMSTHVTGFKDATPEYTKKLEAYRACEAAGVEPPAELTAFFEGVPPSYVEDSVQCSVPATIWRRDTAEGFEVRVSEIPEGVTRIRFYNSY